MAVRDSAQNVLSRLLFVSAVSGLVACAGAPRPEPQSTALAAGGDDTAAEAQPAPEASGDDHSLTLGASGAPEYLGVIDRAGLRAIVDQGLGRVLARLQLSPVLLKGKFQGFRVNQIDPAWAASGVAVNDVLRRLNGAPIERPEQAMAAFESLRVASELALELSREGQILSLRYRIEDSASTSSPSAPP